MGMRSKKCARSMYICTVHECSMLWVCIYKHMYTESSIVTSEIHEYPFTIRTYCMSSQVTPHVRMAGHVSFPTASVHRDMVGSTANRVCMYCVHNCMYVHTYVLYVLVCICASIYSGYICT